MMLTLGVVLSRIKEQFTCFLKFPTHYTYGTETKRAVHLGRRQGQPAHRLHDSSCCRAGRDCCQVEGANLQGGWVSAYTAPWMLCSQPVICTSSSPEGLSVYRAPISH